MISSTETIVESKITAAELSAKSMSNNNTPELLLRFPSIAPLQPVSQVMPEINKEASEFAVASSTSFCSEFGIDTTSGSGVEQDIKASVAASMVSVFITSIFHKITRAIHLGCTFCYTFAE